MKRYRKKPISIEAVQWCGDNWSEVAEWVYGEVPELAEDDYDSDDFTIVPAEQAGQLSILTLEGEMYANTNDWIIKGVQGEFYPCKPDIFDMTYEEEPDGL